MIQQCTVVVTWVEDWGKLHMVEMVDVNEALRKCGQSFQPELIKHLYHHFIQHDEQIVDMLNERGEELTLYYIDSHYPRNQQFDCTIYLQAHSEEGADSVLFRLSYLLKQWRGLKSLTQQPASHDEWRHPRGA
ncbi:MAG: hypothetical protein KC496_14875 [Anaerolineae bacterium]|nr:hypothetical protein [Anaerolineae bacterium]